MSSSATSFPSLLRRSKFATYDPLISRIYTSPSHSSKRGDWGFKYSLPPSTSARPRPKYLKVDKLVGEVRGGEYNSGEKEARFVERWGDGRFGWVSSSSNRSKQPEDNYRQQHGVKDGSYAGLFKNSNKVNKDDFIALDETMENGGSGSGSNVPPPKFMPDIEIMSERQFEAYLDQVREYRSSSNRFKSSMDLATNSTQRINQTITAELADQTGAELASYSSQRMIAQPHHLGGLAYSKMTNKTVRDSSPLLALPGRIIDITNNSEDRARRASSRNDDGFVAGIGGITAKVDTQDMANLDETDFTREDRNRGSKLFRIREAKLIALPKVVANHKTANLKIQLPDDFAVSARGGRVSALKSTSPLDKIAVEMKASVANNTDARMRRRWGGARARGDAEWVGYDSHAETARNHGIDFGYQARNRQRRDESRPDAKASNLSSILSSLRKASTPFAEVDDRSFHTSANSRGSKKAAAADDLPTADPNIDAKGSQPISGPGVGAPKQDEGLAKGEWRQLEENVAGEVRYGDDKNSGAQGKEEKK